MKVLLAGCNVDAEILKELKDKAGWTADNITPETLSAAYARISRDPADIEELRRISRTETDKARKSNQTIIFGLGHSSVAEHAVFNFDVIGVSRLAAEFVQKFRLASFTEKSQRYISLDGDFIMPAEITEAGLTDEFRNVIESQNRAYFIIYEKLKAHLFRVHAEKLKEKFGERTVDGWAKEDARYAVSLATKTQFGMTVNARTLEHMLRRFNASDLTEMRELGAELFSHVKKLAPSVIKYTEASPYDKETPKALSNLTSRIIPAVENSDVCEVSLVYNTPDIDDTICAAILFEHSNESYEAALSIVKSLSNDNKKDIIKTALSNRECWDNVDRVFETVEFTFDLVVSASNYAQLKRHRLSTQIIQDYDISLGYTMPPNIADIGMESLFSETMDMTSKFYKKLAAACPSQKDYILTNAHRRRILLKLNMRELYHFTALREDEHAQWDIRKTARKMRVLAGSMAPLASIMLTGKSGFEQKRKCVFGG